MTVFPGFGGQAYIPESTDRIRRSCARWWTSTTPRARSRWTAASTPQTIARGGAAGANVFVAGTAVFRRNGGPTAGVKELEALAK